MQQIIMQTTIQLPSVFGRPAVPKLLVRRVFRIRQLRQLYINSRIQFLIPKL